MSPPGKSPAASNAIGWYVHLPFCRTKCGYCDFYSLPTVSTLITPLVKALRREVEARAPSRPVKSVFFGGGTPTVLPPDALSEVLGMVRFFCRDAPEFTVEANPATVDELKLDMLREHGVNRLSFGVQSFDERDLQVLERIHDPGDVAKSVEAARRAGFDNFNLDLIFAVPGQTLETWRANLARAIDLQPTHIACYGLTYEAGTALTRQMRQGHVQPCEEGLEVEMYEAAIDTLTAAGYEHYEISNFARPGRRCQANVLYWENGEYLGVGPSAVSYLDGQRRKNVADIRRYITGMAEGPDAVVAEVEELGPRRRAGETAFQMLRLTEGLSSVAFRRATGLDPFALFSGPIALYSTVGLLEVCGDAIRLTRRGLLLANRVMEEFLFEGEDAPDEKSSETDPLLHDGRGRVPLPVLRGGNDHDRAALGAGR